MTESDKNGAGDRVQERILEQEMCESFIDYSMSVNVQRALPDVRDGLKPVHRRILYAMSELGLSPGRAYKKCATVVGEVLGKYHPHGDGAVYDALVRMVQEFSLRYPLVDGQGNFGSLDGDSAAAYRYTEARLQRLSIELLANIEKETVRFDDNFDGRLQEPTVLPSKAPNLLINGSSGIAVGMATNIPPHNLREVVDGLLALIENPQLSQEELETLIPGPDFPTGGDICGVQGIQEAYRTGRGRLVLRAKVEIEEEDVNASDKSEQSKVKLPRIIVTEIPFQVNKSRLIEQIAGLVRDKKITTIRGLRDESDRDGVRIVIELKRDAVPRVVLNALYKHTQMQSTFGAIFLALVDGVPKVMPLREMLTHFINHRHTVVLRRSKFDLGKAKEREEILEGLRFAADNIDEVVRIIRSSHNTDEATEGLRNFASNRVISTAEKAAGEPQKTGLSDRQTQAILNMRLARLTGLEIEKLDQELGQVREQIAELNRILGDRAVRMELIKDELKEIRKRYGDDRRSVISKRVPSFDIEDLIPDEEMVITLSHKGYIKAIPISTYRTQLRGGRGKQGMSTNAEDWVKNLFVASAHDYLTVFTDKGRCHWVKVWRVPQGTRTSKGKPIVNFLEWDNDESVAAVVPVRDFAPDQFLFFCTRNGVVKKTPLSAYKNVRAGGIKAINIRKGDQLIDVRITDGDNDIVLTSRGGKSIRFLESEVRSTGRVAAGVRGIRLAENDEVVGMVVVKRDGATLFVATETGMGKRSDIGAYPLRHRGGLGVLTLRRSQTTGMIVATKSVIDQDELILITRKGVVNRQRVSEMRVIGRATQGVRLMSLDEGDSLVDVARVAWEDKADDADGGEDDSSSVEAVEALAETE